MIRTDSAVKAAPQNLVVENKNPFLHSFQTGRSPIFHPKREFAPTPAAQKSPILVSERDSF
jgi:hypothetical protein